MQNRSLTPWFVLLGLLLAAMPWVINSAPNEATMGLVYKIFYIHLPSAWVFFIAAMVCGVSSALVLFRNSKKAGMVSAASAELVVLFGLMTLVTGPLWARKAWGVWWVWDARLTSSLIMWMMFAGVLLLRQYGGPGSGRLAAAVSLFGMANVPFVYTSVNVWRTMHPPTSVVPSLPVSMGAPLWFSFGTLLLFFVLLLLVRVRLERLRDALDEEMLERD